MPLSTIFHSYQYLYTRGRIILKYTDQLWYNIYIYIYIYIDKRDEIYIRINSLNHIGDVASSAVECGCKREPGEIKDYILVSAVSPLNITQTGWFGARIICYIYL